MSVPFQLSGPPTLSRSTVDRNEPVRTDPGRLAELWTTGRVILLDEKGRTPVGPDATSLATRPASAVADERPADAHLLGEHEGVGYWAVHRPMTLREGVASPDSAWGRWTGAASEDGEEWHDLRTIGALLDDTSAGLYTTAVALTRWHNRARFCGRCGARTEARNAGWATHCAGCGLEEYPRTDPAVICLVHDDTGVNGEHVLLARQPVWPPERYSVLAGFVEAGESLEACVAREVAEEVSVPVHDIRYLGSQPWPFPRSIMVGFAAVAPRGAPLHPADGEIEEAHWISRARVREALDAGGEIEGLRLPGPTSIARMMLTGWAGSQP
ncbi:NAD(+) diphosphatase [Actinophytocola gossypii]|uniref:NAD(+) diphosphatase n=1 Tax=Actinophytocola gossypii TaxID=2812003 RepID=A0ABT2JHI2_9PSEU|nr:NAD(+) diphosphatase [Actinophytocola gossypii]MCT2587346.1 NAD(+) diphosphatase [Actinophytocola gossypii]